LTDVSHFYYPLILVIPTIYMQQALNEQAKIDQKLVFDYGLTSQVNLEVIEVLDKNESDFYNVRVRLTDDNELHCKDNVFIHDEFAKAREITDFMVI
jgi:hypothetical protein